MSSSSDIVSSSRGAVSPSRVAVSPSRVAGMMLDDRRGDVVGKKKNAYEVIDHRGLPRLNEDSLLIHHAPIYCANIQCA